MHQHRFSTAFSGAIVVALSLAACTGDAEPDVPPTPSAVTPISATGPTASPTPPALPEEPPANRGPTAVDCVNGWVTPKRGSARYEEPLRLIRRVTGVPGRLVVVDMRTFEGPESPPSDKGYLLDVRRWYVKAFAKDAPPPLLERFAEKVAQLLIAEFGAPWVRVRVAKLGALAGVKEIGVEIERTRAE